MSGVAMKWARGQRFGSVGMKALVNAMAARADDSGVTWASQATLAEDMGATERHVRQMLATLTKLGVITRQPRSAGRKGRLSDLLFLAMHRQFALSRCDIRRARKRPPTETRVPLEKTDSKSSNRNSTTVTTGTRSGE